VARAAFKPRAELVERCFAHLLDHGGMRRTWLRGRENVHKRYLIHVVGHNLGVLMRQLIGNGTPREALDRGLSVSMLVWWQDQSFIAAILLTNGPATSFAAVIVILSDES
jgi:hypothetical protein